jgi:uncharacterized membrane protein YbhN (UPF0104 family)
MKKKYRNIFFLIGLVAIVVMLATFHVSLTELMDDLRKAGWWFLGVLGLWLFLYSLNTITWRLLLRSTGPLPMPFWKLYKITITSFALNSATPCGLMGSEPYKIMEMTPYVGVNRATSSVILFDMMHIFSHFWFWLTGVFLYIAIEHVNVFMACLLTVIGLFCVLGLYFFIVGYRNGLAVKCLRLCGHIPGLKRWARGFAERQHDNLAMIDKQIAELHSQSRVTFGVTLALEYVGRILSCLEVFLILHIFEDNVNFLECILIMAFTSLFANMLFFIPMQVGGREGGFAMSVHDLSIPARYGVFVGLICRVREIIFTTVGMLLMKVASGVPEEVRRQRRMEEESAAGAVEPTESSSSSITKQL